VGQLLRLLRPIGICPRNTRSTPKGSDPRSGCPRNTRKTRNSEQPEGAPGRFRFFRAFRVFRGPNGLDIEGIGNVHAGAEVQRSLRSLRCLLFKFRWGSQINLLLHFRAERGAALARFEANPISPRSTRKGSDPRSGCPRNTRKTRNSEKPEGAPGGFSFFRVFRVFRGPNGLDIEGTGNLHAGPEFQRSLRSLRCLLFKFPGSKMVGGPGPVAPASTGASTRRAPAFALQHQTKLLTRAVNALDQNPFHVGGFRWAGYPYDVRFVAEGGDCRR
jgi:hypothetical protein